MKEELQQIQSFNVSFLHLQIHILPQHHNNRKLVMDGMRAPQKLFTYHCILFPVSTSSIKSFLNLKDIMTWRLPEYFNQMKLKGDPIKCSWPASEEDIDRCYTLLIFMEPSLDPNKLTKKDLASYSKLQAFLNTHCHSAIKGYSVGVGRATSLNELDVVLFRILASTCGSIFACAKVTFCKRDSM